MTLRSYLAHFTAAVVLAVAVGGVAAAQAAAVTDDNVAQKVESATTAADHQALAAFFNAKAEAAARNANRHKSMVHAYGGSRDIWGNHCRSLVKTFTEQEKDYKALAAEQETLAKEASK